MASKMKHKTNYGDLPRECSKEETAKIVIVPVPYDMTSTWGKGADKGPEAIIEASANMELYDIETDSEVYLNGIFTDKPVTEKRSPEQMVQSVEKKVASYLDKGKFVVMIGGEHSVSIGSIYAFSKKFKDFAILQLDAHSDLRKEYHGSKFNHACVMARAKEVCPIFQVGIRSMDSSEKENVGKGQILYAEELVNDKNWVRKVVDKLPKNVYLTVDLDVFDPAFVPGTGTPEPGGLSWYDVIALVKELNRRKNLVGFDVVELCPRNDEHSSDFLAAKLIYKILSYVFRKKA